MKELKYFNTNDDYTTNKDSFEYPTVSYVEEDAKVYYKEKPEVRIVTYTTTGASQQVRLVYKQEYLDYCKIVENREELPVTGTGALTYTFTDPGEHQVEMRFKDDATTLASVFANCLSLTRIPENLFSNNTAVTDFSRTFAYCSGLTSIPENLFSYNTAVTAFTYTFGSCGLTNIPENLFSNCTAVTDFEETFGGCSGLTGSIPENLFSNNTAVTTFTWAFYSCTGLTGNVPVDNDGTPIYNRSGSGKENYAIVTNYTDCFYNCTGLTDYSSIPTAWK